MAENGKLLKHNKFRSLLIVIFTDHKNVIWKWKIKCIYTNPEIPMQPSVLILINVSFPIHSFISSGAVPLHSFIFPYFYIFSTRSNYLQRICLGKHGPKYGHFPNKRQILRDHSRFFFRDARVYPAIRRPGTEPFVFKSSY